MSWESQEISALQGRVEALEDHKAAVEFHLGPELAEAKEAAAEQKRLDEEAKKPITLSPEEVAAILRARKVSTDLQLSDEEKQAILNARKGEGA